MAALPITIVVALLASGCQVHTSDLTEGAEEAEGYGDAIVAFTSEYDTTANDPHLQGSLILVDADGSFRAIGIDRAVKGAEVGIHDGVLFASGEETDYRVSRDRVEVIERSDTDGWQHETQDVQHRALATDLGSLAVFNTGTLNTDEYYWDLLLDDGQRQVRGTLTGEFWGAASCDGQIMAVTASWQNPGKGTTRLVRLVPDADGIEVETVARLRQPAGGWSPRGLSCSGDRWYQVNGGPGSKSHVAEITPEGNMTWHEVHFPGEPEVTSFDMAVGGRVLAPVLYDGGVVSIDVRPGSMGGVDVIGLGEAYTYATRITGEGWMSLTDRRDAGKDPVVRWHEPNGAVTRELVVEGLADYLADVNEAIGRSPTGGPVEIPAR